MAPHIEQNLFSVTCSDCFEPLFINHHIFYKLDSHSEGKLFQLFSELFTINNVYGDCAVTGRFLHSLACEIACRDEEAFVCAPLHCSPKISNFTGPD